MLTWFLSRFAPSKVDGEFVGAGRWRRRAARLVEFLYGFVNGGYPDQLSQWIGLRENLQESPIFNGKIYGFL